jgi:hypothetical protein
MREVQVPYADGTERCDGGCLIHSWTRFNSWRQYVKLSELKTAREIHKQDMRAARRMISQGSSILFRYYAGWLPNQVEILWLKYKPKGRWVPFEQAEQDHAGEDREGSA